MKSFYFLGDCEEGWRCKRRENCPEFKEEQAKLEALPSFSSQWLELLSKLMGLECNKKENGVCCRTQYKIVNGNIVKQVEELPFMARIHIKTGFGTSAFCGATLIHSTLLLTAKHCIEPYWTDNCIDETDCLAFFRDLIPGRTNHEPGQFYIPIVELFSKQGRSDLAILKLAYSVIRCGEFNSTEIYHLQLRCKNTQTMRKAPH